MNHSLTTKHSFSSRLTRSRIVEPPNQKVTRISSKRQLSSPIKPGSNLPQDRQLNEHQYCVICSSVLCRQIKNGVSSWYCSRCHNILSDSLVQAFSPTPHSTDEMRDRFFINHSASIKIIQFYDDETGHYESVVFPGQHVIFTISNNTVVNIKSGDYMTSLKADTLQGKDLPSVDLLNDAETTPAA